MDSVQNNLRIMLAIRRRAQRGHARMAGPYDPPSTPANDLEAARRAAGNRLGASISSMTASNEISSLGSSNSAPRSCTMLAHYIIPTPLSSSSSPISPATFIPTATATMTTTSASPHPADKIISAGRIVPPAHNTSQHQRQRQHQQQARQDWLVGLNLKAMERTLFRRFGRSERQASALLQNELLCLSALAIDPRLRAVVDAPNLSHFENNPHHSQYQNQLSGISVSGALSLGSIAANDVEVDAMDTDGVVDIDVDSTQDQDVATSSAINAPINTTTTTTSTSTSSSYSANTAGAAPARAQALSRQPSLLRVPSMSGQNQQQASSLPSSQASVRIQVPTVPVPGVLGVAELLEDSSFRYVVYESMGSDSNSADIANANAGANASANANANAIKGVFTDLQSILKLHNGLQEHLARCLFKRLVEIVANMHRHGVIHRDIKISNILLGKSTVSEPHSNLKIRDFRFASILPALHCKKTDRVVFDDSVSGVIGAPAYLAPEILAASRINSGSNSTIAPMPSRAPAYPLSLRAADITFDMSAKMGHLFYPNGEEDGHGRCDDDDKDTMPSKPTKPSLCNSKKSSSYSGFAADMYALGVLLFVMLVGSYPFTASTPEALLEKIRLQERVAIPSSISREARQVLESLLAENPAQRPSAETLLSQFDWLAHCTASFVATEAPAPAHVSFSPSVPARTAAATTTIPPAIASSTVATTTTPVIHDNSMRSAADSIGLVSPSTVWLQQQHSNNNNNNQQQQQQQQQQRTYDLASSGSQDSDGRATLDDMDDEDKCDQVVPF